MTLLLSLALAGLWLALAMLFAGVGLLVLGDAGDGEDAWSVVHLTFWAGAATVTAALMVWHLVLPVDGSAVAVVLGLSAIGWSRGRSLPAHCLRSVSWGNATAILIVAVWVANHALNTSGLDDHNYEFQATRWIHDFAIVPGLANLHGRLGFNNAQHLLAALLSVGPLAGHVNHVLNGLFISVLLAYLGTGLARVGRSVDLRPSELARALLLSPAASTVIFGTYGEMVSTLKADVIVGCSVLLLSCLIFELAESQPRSPRYLRTAAVMLLVAAFAASVKMNATAFAGVMLIGVCVRLLVDRRSHPAPGRSWLLSAALALSVAMVVLTPVRSVILSGYPAYPSTVGGMNVDWRVSEAQAAAERALIISTGWYHPSYRIPMPPLPERLAWWGHWTVLTEKYAIALPALIVAIGLAALLVAHRSRRPEWTTPGWVYVTLAAASAAGVAEWFLAPAGRFGSSFFWAAAAGVLVWLRQRVTGLPRAAVVAASLTAAVLLTIATAFTRLTVSDYPALILLTIAAVAWLVLFDGPGRRSPAMMCVLGLALATCEPAGRLAADVAHARYRDAADYLWLTPDRRAEEKRDVPVPRRTLSGLTVYDVHWVAYDTPIPNTHYFNPYLELRRPGSLASGFRARLPPDLVGPGYEYEGPWRPATPPAPKTPAG